MSMKPYTNDDFKNDARMYVDMLGMLLLLTLVTFIQPAMIPAGATVTMGLQLAIALCKAILIVAYYMHLKNESKILKGFVYFVCVVLVFLFSIMIMDTRYDDSSSDAFQDTKASITLKQQGGLYV